jgi:hypothetical protein
MHAGDGSLMGFSMRHLGAVVLLFCVACGNGHSPLEPTPTAGAAATYEVRLSGSVTDTASRALAGATVQIVGGPTAGMATTTDDHGRFLMPGTFTGTATVRASKDGYEPETTALPPSIPPGRSVPLPPPGEVVRWDMGFSLQPDGPSANLAGVYTLTLSTDSSCTTLPEEARTRTYTVTIVPGLRSTRFVGTLGGARIVFAPYSPYFEIGVARDFANASFLVVEQLTATTFLAIEGGATASVGPSGFTAPFNASFLHCPTMPTYREYWWCGAEVQGIECNSPNHQFTLVRR